MKITMTYAEWRVLFDCVDRNWADKLGSPPDGAGIAAFNKWRGFLTNAVNPDDSKEIEISVELSVAEWKVISSWAGMIFNYGEKVTSDDKVLISKLRDIVPGYSNIQSLSATPVPVPSI